MQFLHLIVMIKSLLHCAVVLPPTRLDDDKISYKKQTIKIVIDLRQTKNTNEAAAHQPQFLKGSIKVGSIRHSHPVHKNSCSLLINLTSMKLKKCKFEQSEKIN